MVETLIGWVIIYCLFPGIITLSMLDTKGIKPIKGFCLGFCLSYVGVIIAWFMPVNNRQREDKTNKIIEQRKKTLGLIQGTMKTCPYCRQITEMNAMKCKYCGKQI
jgi:hypothetical protein